MKTELREYQKKAIEAVRAVRAGCFNEPKICKSTVMMSSGTRVIIPLSDRISIDANAHYDDELVVFVRLDGSVVGELGHGEA